MRRFLAILLLALWPGSVWAAISYIGATFHTTDSQNGPLLLTLPTVSANDFLYLTILHRDDGTLPTVTDTDVGGNTWTNLQDSTVSSAAGTGWWKRATSATTGKVVTMSMGALTPHCMSALLLVYRGVTTSGTPYEALSAVDSTAQSHPAITTLTNNAVLVLSLLHTTNTGSSDSAWAAGGTAFTDGNISANVTQDCRIVTVSLLEATAGSTGTMTWTGGATPASHWAFAIKPDVGGGGATCVPTLMLLGVSQC